jgi:hypothetical protein
VLELRIGNCDATLCGVASTYPTVQLFWADYVNNTEKLINAYPLTPAELTFPQVALTLTKADGSDVVTAAYAVGVFSSLADIPTILVKVIAQTDASTDVFTPANPFVLPGFEAIDPVTVPEPTSIVLLGGGLAAFGLLRRRRS